MKIRLFLFLLAVSSLLHAETLVIAAGAGYKRPLADLARSFEAASGHRVEAFYGNMGQVMAQTRQSDNIALVLGDLDFLQHAKTVEFSRFVTLGSGRLVLAYAKGKTLPSAQALRLPGFARIALPDTRKAVYGKAAQEYLNGSGLAEALRGKLMIVATVPQVSAYLVSGEIDAGFINLTDALAIRNRIGGYLELPQQGYGPIRIVGGVVKGRESTPALQEFIGYLASSPARSTLAQHGL